MVDWRVSAPPLCPTKTPPCSTPPPKRRTFLREQMSDRQAHGQTHRHSHAARPSETDDRRKFAGKSQSHSTWERPGAEEGMGGPVSGNTEPERDEGSETDSKMARGRQTRVQAHTTHTDTHTRRHRQREGDTEPLTDRKRETDMGERMASDPRQTHWHPP